MSGYLKRGIRNTDGILLRDLIEGVLGTSIDGVIQELTSCTGWRAYLDTVTGDIYIPRDLANGVVRTGTWTTASSAYWVKKTLLSNGIEKIITDASGSYAIPFMV